MIGEPMGLRRAASPKTRRNSSFTFPYGIVELDTSAIQKYPIEYAPLAYLLQQSGFPVTSIYPTKGSDLEKTIKAEGKTWLKA
jgi:hypothetical protein